MKALRWFSWMNDFMDFVVIVKDEDMAEAEKAIYAGIDHFWEGDCEPYGSLVEEELQLREITYAIAYIPYDYANDCVINEESWENWISTLDKVIAVKHIHS